MAGPTRIEPVKFCPSLDERILVEVSTDTCDETVCVSRTSADGTGRLIKPSTSNRVMSAPSRVRPWTTGVVTHSDPSILTTPSFEGIDGPSGPYTTSWTPSSSDVSVPGTRCWDASGRHHIPSAEYASMCHALTWPDLIQ